MSAEIERLREALTKARVRFSDILEANRDEEGAIDGIGLVADFGIQEIDAALAATPPGAEWGEKSPAQFVLSAEAFDRFLEMCENPPAPTEALKKLFRDYGVFATHPSPPASEPQVNTGDPATPSGSRASHEAANASSPPVSIPIAKHTKGPWTRRDTADYAEIVAPDGTKVALVGREDDADLISASPDLLAAAKALGAVSDAIYIQMSPAESEAMGAAWAVLEDAVAKAEGQS